MKKFILLLCLFTAHLSIAQSDLDNKITEFATSNKLYNKKLQKLVSVYEDQTLSETERLQEWNKIYQKWDSKGATESFNAEFELIQFLRGLMYQHGDMIGGYNLNYLLWRLNENAEKGAISPNNRIIIEHILRKQWKDKPEVASDVLAMSSSIEKFFEKYPKMKEVNQLLHATDLRSIPAKNENFQDVFYRLSETHKMTLRKCLLEAELTAWEVCQQKYSLNFSPKTAVGDELRLNLPYHNGDDLKFADFLTVPEIEQFIRLRTLLLSFTKFESDQLNGMKLRTAHEKFRRFTPVSLLSIFQDGYDLSGEYLLINEDKSAIQNLLVAAHNDVYVYFDQSDRNFGSWKLDRLDFNQMELSDSEKRLIDVILNDDASISKVGLELVLSDEILYCIDWDLEFQLACFLAIYYKSMDIKEEWNNTSYHPEPFSVTTSDSSYSFKNFSEEDWNKLKDRCREVLIEEGYGNGQFIITYNGKGELNCFPNIHAYRELFAEVLEEFRGNIEMPYFRMIIQTGEGEQLDDQEYYFSLERDVPNVYIGGYRDVAPPPPPAQRIDAPVSVAEIVDFPDVEPSFPGGNEAMKKWIEENMVYPQISRENGDQGKVYVHFVVETDGTISNVSIMRRGLTEELNQEALRLIQTMPKWIPGEVKGRVVRTLCRLPITFQLEQEE